MSKSDINIRTFESDQDPDRSEIDSSQKLNKNNKQNSFFTQLRYAFANINKQVQDKWQVTEKCFYVFKELSRLEYNYSAGLNKLATMIGNSIVKYEQNTNTTIQKALNQLKNELYNKSLFSLKYSENVSKYCYEPISNFIKNNTLTNKTVLDQGSKQKKELVDLQGKYERLKIKQHKSAKESEDAQVFIASASPMMTNDRRMRLQMDANKKRHQTEDYEREFDELISQSESFIKNQEIKMKYIMNVLQSIDVNRINIIKESMMTQYIQVSEYQRTYMYDIEKNSLVMQEIDSNIDIEKTIQELLASSNQKISFEFIPYISEYSSENSGGHDNKPYQDEHNINIKKLENIFNSVHNKEIISEKDLDVFQNIISTKDVRCAFIDMIKKYISNINEQNVSENNQNNLSFMFRSVLDHCLFQQDIQVSREILYLSQTLYCQKDKIQFLSDAFADHKIFDSLNFWTSLISDSISNELDKNKINRNFRYTESNENNDDLRNRERNIIQGQLGSYACTMCQFKVEKFHVSNIIKKFAISYDLNDNQIKLLLETVNNQGDKNCHNDSDIIPTIGKPQWLNEMNLPDDFKSELNNRKTSESQSEEELR